MPQFMHKTSTVVILLIVGFAVAGYLYYKNHKESNNESEPSGDAPVTAPEV